MDNLGHVVFYLHHVTFFFVLFPVICSAGLEKPSFLEKVFTFLIFSGFFRF